MGDRTGISWTDATWNPIRGCSRISEGCMRCYAERIAERFSGPGQVFEGFAERGRGWTRKVELIPEQLAVPLRWKRGRRIFCSSMTDVFHESLSNEAIAAVFGVMAACPQHTFQVLTKRAKRMREWFEWVQQESEHPLSTCGREWISAMDFPVTSRSAAGRATIGPGARWPLPNVWLGVSVENQNAADERIPELLATPAAVRFLSCEPLIGPVDLSRWLEGDTRVTDDDEDAPDGAIVDGRLRVGKDWARVDHLHLVIAGCESGPGARPCEVAWLRQLRDQCAAARVAFWLKQARHHVEPGNYPLVGDNHVDVVGAGPGSKRKPSGVIELPYLDGVQHAAFPEVQDRVKHDEG